MRIERGTVEAQSVKAVYVDDVRYDGVIVADDDAGYIEYFPKGDDGMYLTEGEYFVTRRVNGAVRIET